MYNNLDWQNCQRFDRINFSIYIGINPCQRNDWFWQNRCFQNTRFDRWQNCGCERERWEHPFYF